MEYVTPISINLLDQNICEKVTLNAKMRRPGICGATETILCDKDAIKSHLPKLIDSLIKMDVRLERPRNKKIDSTVKLAKIMIGQLSI